MQIQKIPVYNMNSDPKVSFKSCTFKRYGHENNDASYDILEDTIRNNKYIKYTDYD